MTRELLYGKARSGFRGKALTVATVAMLVTAGCTPGGSDSSSPETPSDTTTTPLGPPPGLENLSKFYSQQVKWEQCTVNQCAWLTVPVDYSKPDGETLKLRMLKAPARDRSRGVLFVNPGGPGGSAVDYAEAASFIVTPHMRKSYDVVGVDPRGVGKSNPIVCLGDAQMDEMMGADPTLDDAADRAEGTRIAKNFAQSCQSKYPALLPHLSTVDVAKDMDIARAVLGQKQMTYLGKSYGTYLGAVYAEQFPKHVGRFVLDGAMAPDLTNKELNLGQAKGFETATRAYVAHCVKEGNCPIGGSVDEGMKALRDMMQQLDAQPIPIKGDERVKQLTEGWASTGVASVMYAEKKWDSLTVALRGVKAGDGTDLFRLANEYVERKDGQYTGNIMQVISAVNCLDHPVEQKTEAEEAAEIAEFVKEAPTWGRFMAGSSLTCLNWPVKGTTKPRKITGADAPPIMVVGTTRDPATPYEWAERLSRQLKDSKLVTYDGDGHTAYMRSNRCVNDAVDGFVVDGKMPDKNVRC